MVNFNTIALAYVDKDDNVVAWSSDTFGTPSKYPKTYMESEKNFTMLSKKFEQLMGRKDFTSLKKVNPVANDILDFGTKKSKEYLEYHGVVGSRVARLDLVTNYERGNYSPTWDQVTKCVDNGNFSLFFDLNEGKFIDSDLLENGMEGIEIRPLTEDETDLLYGERKVEVGKYFKKVEFNMEHFYLQRENDVLHVNRKGIINSLHVGALNNTDNTYTPTTEDEFMNAYLEVFNLIKI
jgi:hypothetical protein